MKFTRRTISDEIPTASMADITFLLIIFFMVTNTFAATRGLDFAIPKDDKSTPLVEREESVLIAIHAGGAIEVDGRAMRPDQILEYLKPKLAINQTKPVIIRPDPDAAYGDMVRVYDVLREGKNKGVEVRNINVPTQREIDQFWY
ncbi:MAG: biopolymer transporter ExbD [Thermoanaerobaculia bacterium]|nr:MAG: biopolymer transporter ExbD [Thermoanaerobaculia bacterium]